ncbi:MAG: di-trans,poly-cis-decaprenylcistransferase, partial [Omnitrophica WOR_2 bacterium RIFCSPHIGHO2_02_FULL_45_21]
RLVDSQAATKDCNGLTVVLAFNYGGRAEIIDAAKKMARAALDRKIDPDDISEENFERFLYTAGLPDPDLLIRTSGELRISNFLLWQLSYAELYFSSLCWPDFKREDLEEAIAVYQGRVRRFGGVSPHEARG